MGVLINDTDVDMNPLTAQLVAAPDVAAGTVSLAASGGFVFTPAQDFHGVATFTYQANDGLENSNTATVTITVDPVNDAPVAVADTYTTNEDTTLSRNAAEGLLSNDSDVDGDVLAVSLEVDVNPANGTLSLLNDGSFVFTPALNFNGNATFTYSVTDPSEASSAIVTVTITVNPINDPPVATNDLATTDEDVAITIAVLANDSDVDGDMLTVTGTGGGAGAVVINANNTITYTPPANFGGNDSFTYTVSDGNGGSDTETVFLTITPVNDAPVAVDDSATTDEDTAVTITVLGNDTDVENDELTVTGATQPAHGVVSPDPMNPNRIIYTPSPNYNGDDSFTYTITDGNGGTDTGAVNLTVDPVNDAPVAVDDTATTDEDTAVTVTVLGNDTDVDVDALSVQSFTAPAHGTVTRDAMDPDRLVYEPAAHYNGPDSFTYVVSDGNGGTDTASVSITVNAINDAPVANDDAVTTDEDTAVTITVLGNDTDVENDELTVTGTTQPAHGVVSPDPMNPNRIIYTPSPNYNGDDSFTYTITDGNGGTDTGTVDLTVDPVNDAPVAGDDNDTTDEDTAVTVTVLGNDTDVENDTLTVTALGAVAPVGAGSVAIAGMGTTVTFTPALNYNSGLGGDVTFTYTVSDGNGGTDEGLVTIVVTAVNDAPVAGDDSYMATEDEVLTIAGAAGVLGNDTDVEGDTLRALVIDNVTHGTLTLNQNGGFTYTPSPNYNGPDGFTYRSGDGNGGTDVGTVTLTVGFVNDTPVATGESYDATEDTLLVANGLGANPPGLLANDTDVDLAIEGDDLDVVLVAPPAQGVLTLNEETGTFTYLPAANSTDGVAFFYKVVDSAGAESEVVAVTITIIPVNDTPDARDDAFAIDEDSAANSLPVLANDVDLADLADTFFVAAVQDPATVDGALDLAVAPDSLSVLLTPDPDYNSDLSGPITFTYTIRDRSNPMDPTALTDTAIVTVTVNPQPDAPVAVDDLPGTPEDVAVVIDVLGVGQGTNDYDVDGDTLTVISFTQPANGAVVRDMVDSNKLVYTPNLDYNNTTATRDTFTYVIDDGTDRQDTGTVGVLVSANNDAPVAADDAYTVDEDSVANVFDVRANDTDTEDGNTLTIIAIDTISPAAAVGSLTINAMDATILFSPAADFNSDLNGQLTFDYVVEDSGGLTSRATVTVTIDPLPDAPVAVDDGVMPAITTNEEAPVTVAALDNDFDVDGDSLTIESTSMLLPATSGTLQIVNDMAGDRIEFTPAVDFFGTVTFDYTISDGDPGTMDATASVTIEVTNINDAPVAVADGVMPTIETPEDTPLVISRASLTANDTDADGDVVLVARISAQPAHGTLTVNGDGTYTYRPAAHYNGPDAFTYVATDSMLESNEATVTLLVTAVNDAPVGVADSYNGGTEEIDYVVAAANGVLINDTDPDIGREGDSLTAQLVAGSAVGGMVVNLNANGAFTFRPALNFFGTATFRYTVRDAQGALSAETTVSIAFADVNDPPVAVNDPAMGNEAAYTTNEDTTLTVGALVGLLANDSDPDNNPLTAAVVTEPAHGTLNLNDDGAFTYIPDANYNGLDSFTYNTNDGQFVSNAATVRIVITPRNDNPVGVDDQVTTEEETAITVTVLANDTDVDGDMLTVGGFTQPANGAVVRNGNQLTYTPNLNFFGLDTFTYNISDGNGGNGGATVRVTVTNLNDAPVAMNDAYTGLEDQRMTVVAPGVLGNDVDPDGDMLTVVVLAAPAHGTLALAANGGFTFDPAANYNGLDSFTYTVSDGNGGSATGTVALTLTNVNDTPVAVNDGYLATEDTALTVLAANGVLTNDSDIDGNALTARLVQGPTAQQGILALAANGGFTFTPAANFNGTATFTYQAFDGTIASNVATVTLTVAPVNDNPVASNNSFATNEDVTLTIAAPGVLNNDSDVDGDMLTATVLANVSHGTLTIAADGGFTYIPTPNYNGADSFTYTVRDGNGGSAIGAVALTINPVNDAPVAMADALTTNEDAALLISAAASLLINDSDLDGDPLTVRIVQGPAPSEGVLVNNGNGTFTFTPAANFHGDATFTYQADDGRATSNAATVTITVLPINDAPVANNDNFSTGEDVTLTIAAPGVLTDDRDVDGDMLTVTVLVTVTNGTLTLAADGGFTYDPNANFFGTDTFTYTVRDGNGGSSIGTVRISVGSNNDAPLAANDAYTTDEDMALTIDAPGLLDNDTDLDGDTLTAQLVQTTAAAEGVLMLNENGSFTFTPAANFHGTATFTYQADDGLASSNVATVTITVMPVNDGPVATDDSYSTTEDVTLTIPAPGIRGNDSDVDGNAITVTVLADVANGTLTLAANGGFSYVPNANFNGMDGFTYTLDDGNGGTDIGAVSIRVDGVNDVPVAMDDAYSTGEGAVLTVDQATGVLANDSDLDGNALTARLVQGPPASEGTLTLNANGSFTFRPAANFNGNSRFTYQAFDGVENSNVATVTIGVSSVNDAPVANDDTYSVDEDVTLNIAAAGVLGNDTDVDGDTLSATVLTDVAHGTLTLAANGGFSYVPAANYNGPDGFTYTVADGNGGADIGSVTITVNPINDAPVALADTYLTGEDEALVVEAATGVLSNDTDLDGDNLEARLVQGPPAAEGILMLNADGSFTFTPAANFNGEVTFSYQAFDGLTRSEAVFVTLTVEARNDAPVALGEQYTTSEDVALTIPAPGVLSNDTDIDGDALSAVLVETLVPANAGTLALDPSGSFVYMPAPNFNGTASFTYRADDGTDSSSAAQVTITVSAVNDAPVALADAYLTGEDEALVVEAATGVLSNDSDLDGDNLEARLVQGPLAAEGILMLNADGSFTFTPAANFNGEVTFSYQAFDGFARSEVEFVTLTVEPRNDAPVAVDDTYGTNENQTLTINPPGVLANDIDIDGDALTATLADAPSAAEGEVILRADGAFVFIPAPGVNGRLTFTYFVEDGELQSELATVTIDVGNVNDAPIPTDDAYTVAEDTTLMVAAAEGVLANDADPENDAMTVLLVQPPVHGSVNLSPDGSFSYTPSADFNGEDSFIYRATDGLLLSIDATVTLTVTPTNDAPVAVADTYAGTEEVALTIAAAAGLLTNDSDLDADALTARLVQGPTADQGTVVVNSDGSFTFTPVVDFNGAATFTYVANDGTVDSASAVVTINVANANDAPFFVAPTPETALAALEGTALTFTVAAQDPDGDAVTLSVQVLPEGATFDPATGAFSFTASYDLVGTHTIILTATDGQLTVTRELEIVVSWLDADLDGLPDAGEVLVGLDPTTADSDSDGISDYEELGITGDRDVLAAILSPLNSDDDDLIDGLDDDSDADGISDADEAGDADLETPTVDTDEDGTPDYLDTDSDDDTILDADDNCRVVVNEDQADLDGDGMGDACDADRDGDGLDNDLETLIGTDPDDADSDDDTIDDGTEFGDGESARNTDGLDEIDALDADSDNDGIDDIDEAGDADITTAPVDTDGDGDADYIDTDSDDDGTDDGEDNCRLVANADQADTNTDGNGDACDGDLDGDGVDNDADNCPGVVNADQANLDGDDDGDACDGDDDNDGAADTTDNCPAESNADQADLDGDGDGDICDADADGDDADDDTDNCLGLANADQADLDGDGEGDACDADIDGDTISDDVDNCPDMANADQLDTDGDGEGDLCDETPVPNVTVSGSGSSDCSCRQVTSSPTAPVMPALLLVVAGLFVAVLRRR